MNLPASSVGTSFDASLEPSLAGRAAIVTGAGAGLGRAEAIGLAQRGAHVVLTDIGDMSETAELVRALGAEAFCVSGDISKWALADELVAAALTQFGRLDIVVNNAGITRDSMLFSMTQKQWDDVLDVHLRGHAALGRAAGAHWRDLSKSTSTPTYGRIINTASEAALTGSASQPNYAAAKAAIIALTVAEARSLGKYGVTANAICPRARTAMTAGMFESPSDDSFDPLDPQCVATLVSHLASPRAEGFNGRTFVAYGSMVALVARPSIEAIFTAQNNVFSDDELASALDAYVAPVGKTLANELHDLEVAAGLASA